VEKKAFNTINLFISLGITILLNIILVLFGAGVKGLAWGTTIGLITLGILTTRFLWRRYQLDYRKLHLKEAILINIGLILVAFGFKYFLFDGSRLAMYVCIGIIEIILFAMFIFSLWKTNVPWLFAIRNRILKEPANNVI
jgi:Ca2+/Na+ antiporter